MSLYPDYTTVSEVKALLGVSDTVDDAAIGIAITAASRAIDQHCLRQFGSAEGEVREYDIRGRTVAIEDVTNVTGVAVRTRWDTTETALTAGTGYRLLPLNAARQGKPYTHLELYTEYSPDHVLEVTGTVGWTSVPTPIEAACQIQALRLFKRKDSPFGVAGSPELGSEIRLLAKVDPDVAVLVQGFRRTWGAA